MTTSLLLVFGGVIVLSSPSFGCAPAQANARTASAASPPTATSAGRTPALGERHVYRFDFVLTASDAGGAPSVTAFTLNLEEAEKGEAMIGRNVSLVSGGAARQDVGVKVAASYRTAGDALLLQVSTEMSSVDPPSSVRKHLTKGNVLASAGTSAVVMLLEDEHKKVQLTVTPTKLR